MKIVIAKPPNFEKINEVFDIEGKPVVFTYGDILYNPTDGHVPWHLEIHERIHTRQQGDNPEAWWDRYLVDPAFRVDQEVEAYGAQYWFLRKTVRDRNKLDRYLRSLATDLSGAIYGHSITYHEAITRIKDAAN